MPCVSGTPRDGRNDKGSGADGGVETQDAGAGERPTDGAARVGQAADDAARERGCDRRRRSGAGGRPTVQLGARAGQRALPLRLPAGRWRLGGRAGGELVRVSRLGNLWLGE
jgi:hypothetical protein